MEKMITRRLLYALLPLVLLAQRPAVPQEKTDSSLRQRFIGTWRLVSEENISADGKVSFDPVSGPHGVGYLIYDPNGHMCVGLMNPDRPKWTEPKDLTDKEKIALFDSFYAYCGRYEIKEKEHIMMHLPELASTPDYVGTDQPRPYTFDGDRMTFAGKDTRKGGSWRITWEKVQ